MSTTTMNISLPETLKRFVQERTESANFSNPSDYVRALIREDQRRAAAEQLLADLIAEHNVSAPVVAAGLTEEFWRRWESLKSEIDKGLLSLARDGGKPFDSAARDDIKRRGRERLARSKAV